MTRDIPTLGVLRDLNRVKVLFQARTIAAAMGLPQGMVVPKSIAPQGEYHDQVT